MNISFLNIGKIFSSKKERKVYRTIKKLPISIWWKITDTGDYSLLVQEGEFSEMELYNIYLDMLQEYYDNFGTTETHQAFILARFNYAKALCKFIQSQSGHDKMFLEMAKIDLQEVTPRKEQNQKPFTLGEAITIIEENFVGEKDEDTLTTYKFYLYQKRIREKIEAQKETVRKWRKR